MISNDEFELSSTFDSRGVDASPNQARNRTLPSSDAEIESAGEAFLDVIGKSLGIRYVSNSLRFSFFVRVGFSKLLFPVLFLKVAWTQTEQPVKLDD